MSKRFRENPSVFDGSVRTERGTFSTEPYLIPDDERDELARDPSYQGHPDCYHSLSRRQQELLLQLDTAAPSPEEILIAREREEIGDL